MTTVRCWRCKHEVPEETTVCNAGVGTQCKDGKACRGRWLGGTPTTKSAAERQRLDHSLKQLATTVEMLHKHLDMPGNGAQIAESLLTAARVVAFQLVRLEAFEQVESTAPPIGTPREGES